MDEKKHADPARALRLRATREALGMTQTEICRAAEIGTSTWNNWENKGWRPGIDEALKLAHAVDISLDWIYLGSLAGVPVDFAQRIRDCLRRLRLTEK